MIDMLRNEIEDVKTAYEMLLDGIENLEGGIREKCIPNYSKKGDMAKVIESTNIVNELNSHLDNIHELNKKWKKIMNTKSDEDELEETRDEKDIIEVTERTTWMIENNIIRIETMRPDGSSSYPNVLPVNVFIEVVNTILDQFTRYNKSFIKTSTISTLMKDKIIEETNYKKSPKTLIYSIFKVLLKEEILTTKDNSKRIYTLYKDPNRIKTWLSEL